ncbi:hypothetical protein C8J57DRAFT_1542344 [Mycena rebaudengoi]|nr:hypothetical protein C8J57DRAFT_1542344 [Mycena rebaudengoi]
MHNLDRPPLNFIVVGASVAGLSATIALKQSGHNVLVLEKETQLGGPETVPSGCTRVPPNGCKILCDWGLEAELREHAVVGRGFTVYKYAGYEDSSRDYIGKNRWDSELLTEARGDFLQMAAQGSSTDSFQRRSENQKNETKPTFLGRELPYSSGRRSLLWISILVPQLYARGRYIQETSSLAADGAFGLVRKRLVSEQHAAGEDALIGLAVYSTTIPKSVAMADEVTSMLYNEDDGDDIAPSRENKRMSCAAYTRQTRLRMEIWTTPAERKMGDIAGPSNPLLKRIFELAGPSTCVQIKDYRQLESWVSASGKAVVLGDAAHPFPPSSLHTYSIAIEDGAFIGKIFSHTRNPDRIAEFLNAFEENRKSRCSQVHESEMRHMKIITLPDGPTQEGRDASMRANEAAGRNVLDAPERICRNSGTICAWYLGTTQRTMRTTGGCLGGVCVMLPLLPALKGLRSGCLSIVFAQSTAPRSTITTELLLSFVMQCRIIVAFVLSCIALSVSAAPTPDLSKGLHLLDREPENAELRAHPSQSRLQDVCVHLYFYSTPLSTH